MTVIRRKIRDLQKYYSEAWTDLPGRADNAHVRRITTLGLVVLAGLAFTSSAGAASLRPSACQCGSLVAKGGGTVGNWATGTVWGSVASGTLWMRARSSTSGFGVTHYASRVY